MCGVHEMNSSELVNNEEGRALSSIKTNEVIIDHISTSQLGTEVRPELEIFLMRHHYDLGH